MKDEKIMWILNEFKFGRKNFSETIEEIDKIYAKKLGFLTVLEVQTEMDRWENNVDRTKK